jgi:predicted Zn-dependent protease
MTGQDDAWELFDRATGAASELAARLGRGGMSAVEVYWKSGVSRRYEQRFGVRSEVRCQEHGWAVRSGNDEGSFFATGAGPIPHDMTPTPLGLPLRLPDASHTVPGEDQVEIAHTDSRPTGERFVLRFFEEIEQRLRVDLPRAEVLMALAEEGESRSGLVNSNGLTANSYRRLASLRLWAVDRSSRAQKEASASWLVDMASSLADLDPVRIAARLADRLSILGQGTTPSRSVEPVLLAPEVMVRLLAGLVPLLTDSEQWLTLRALDSDVIGGTRLTLIDDPGCAGAANAGSGMGVFENPRDDEGVVCARTTLIERGSPAQPLLPWYVSAGAIAHESGSDVVRSSGCRWRRSYREPPRVAPSHLYLQPSSEVSVSELVARLGTGFYLVVSEPASFDYKQQRFSVAVAGFRVENGEPVAPVANCRLVGSFASLLKGVAETGRDLRFSALDGMIGSPSVLLEGLELLPGS